jgi:hypothetical protein
MGMMLLYELHVYVSFIAFVVLIYYIGIDVGCKRTSYIG